MQVYGFLEKAQLENVSADLSNTLLGLFWFNTTDSKMKIYDGAVRAMVTEDGAATLTNKIFSGGTITGATISGGNLSGIDINLGVATDANKLVVSKEIRANLEALTREEGSIYFSTDEQKYLGDDGLNLVELGGGGAGGINYTANPDFETNADDHVAYKDSASEVPDDGTGGAPTLAIARSTVSPLDGKASGIISKPASNTQGEGVKVANEDFNEADKGVIQIMSFVYDASDANYNDGDFRVYFKDETNSKIIRVNGEDIKGGKGTHYARVQVPIDCDNGSLIIHCAATHADAVSFKYDRVSFGPQIINSGSIIEDWKNSGELALTSTGTNPTKGTSLVDEVLHRRIGDSLEMSVAYSQNVAGSAGTGVYLINIPSGFKVDVNKIQASTTTTIQTTATPIGTSQISSGATNTAAQGTVYAYDETRLFVIHGPAMADTGAGQAASALESYGASTNMNLGATTHALKLNILVPIAGWSSQSQTSEDFGGREIFVNGEGNGGESITGNTTDITFTEVEDTAASWDGSTFTVPESGIHTIAGSINTTVNSTYDFRLAINGTVGPYIGTNASSDNIGYFKITDRFEKGQVLSVRTTGSVNLQNNTDAHRISISKDSDSQQILETEIVAARYTSDSGQTVPASAVIKYEDSEGDTHGAYNTSTGQYVVPVTGWYSVDAKYRATANGSFWISIYVNNIAIGVMNQNSTDQSTPIISEKIQLNRDDVLEIRNISAGSATLTAFSEYNSFSIARVK